MSLGTVRIALAIGTMVVAACSGGNGLEDACDRRNQLTRPFDLAAEGADLIVRANRARADKGLPPLDVHPSLEEKAQSWAVRMAQEGRPSHSEVPEGVKAKWEKLGENVGQGGRSEAIHDGFLDSPTHYENLIDPDFTHVGVGVASDSSGMRYVSEVFMKVAPAASTTAAPPTTRSSAVVASPPTSRVPKTKVTATTSVPPAAASTGPPPEPVAPVAEDAAVLAPEPLVAPDRPSRCAR